MTARRTPAIRSYPGLVRDIYRLKELIQFNRADSRLSRSREVVYFVDPGMIDLYSEPERWAQRIAALPSLYEDLKDDEPNRHHPVSVEVVRASDSEVLAAAALLTGEYIFSKPFAGPIGQLLIGPEHMPDLLGHVSRIENRYSAAYHRLGRTPETDTEFIFGNIRHLLRGQRVAMANGRIAETEFLVRMRDVIISNLGNVASQSDLIAPYRLDQLISKAVLAEATSLPEFNLDVIAPDYGVVMTWRKRIEKQKANNKVKPTAEALIADAVTLQQIFNLNADSGRSGRVYLLITDDGGLHRAAREYCSENDRPFFPLRRPAQYIPVLNVKDMGGTFDDFAPFSTIEKAVNHLLKLLTSNDKIGRRIDYSEDGEELANYLSNPSRRAALDDMQDEITTAIDDVSDKWIDLLRYACSAKADVIRGAVEDNSDYWQAFTTSAAFRTDFVRVTRSMGKSLSRLGEGSLLLRYEIWALDAANKRPGRDQSDDYSKRAFISRFTEFTSPGFAGLSVSRGVREILRSSDRLSLLSGFRNRTERLVLTGCLCFEIGAWAGAKDLLRRADSFGRVTPEPGTLAREVRFLHCMALRLAAEPSDYGREYARARRTLDEILTTSGEDVFDGVRALSERIALDLCEMAFEFNVGGPNASAERYLERAVDALLHISRAATLSTILGSEMDDGATALAKQIWLNTMDAAFWWRAMYGALDPRLRALAGEAIESYDKHRMNREVSPHASIYHAMADLALDRSSADTLGKSIVLNIDKLIEMDRELGFAFDLPFVDRIEFGKIRGLIMRGAFAH